MIAWLRQWRERLHGPDPLLAARLKALPAPLPPADIYPQNDRLVVLDLETTGLNPRRDRILSVGAVTIEGGQIDLARPFNRIVHRTGRASLRTILVHGLSPGRLARGEAETPVLMDLLEYLGDSPVFAFHAPFDHAMLRRAWRRELGYRRAGPFHDLAALAPALAPSADPPKGLDGWLARFELDAEQRHDAYADAFASAELLLILISRAKGQGLKTLAEWQSLAGRRQRIANLQGP
ncbi:PolC-type DNA polymerase III [Alkalilimnicola sp. S0819]|uniref:3'-5' exonuclease n=1 Tax=Alkalilimnicola sp. S0819 TaxID=2613922 RepID=UPI001261BBC3|nr:3'-5' exonuclease [Alkalilimnicola sp. S0819]KAB7624363.1 3'-5' exonuclease [Alkalilimnicola sp. S0819]MPQ16189.1 3'-5' exonuclease [Alkalilimnicola sp. S0819]